MTWQADYSHSLVQFSGRHMMISTVRGQFEKFTATIDFNEANPEKSSVEAQIEAASINTRFEMRDNHLRSADFLNVEQYPYITFKSKRVEALDSHHARLVGDLTIRDVTREVTLEVEYAGQSKSPWGGVSAGFSARTKIDRKNWGLNWNQALEAGGMLVGDEISIEIEVELVKQPETVEQGETVAA